jgi:hypothetical protein
MNTCPNTPHPSVRNRSKTNMYRYGGTTPTPSSGRRAGRAASRVTTAVARSSGRRSRTKKNQPLSSSAGLPLAESYSPSSHNNQRHSHHNNQRHHQHQAHKRHVRRWTQVDKVLSAAGLVVPTWVPVDTLTLDEKRLYEKHHPDHHSTITTRDFPTSISTTMTHNEMEASTQSDRPVHSPQDPSTETSTAITRTRETSTVAHATSTVSPTLRRTEVQDDAESLRLVHHPTVGTLPLSSSPKQDWMDQPLLKRPRIDDGLED